MVPANPTTTLARPAKASTRLSTPEQPAVAFPTTATPDLMAEHTWVRIHVAAVNRFLCCDIDAGSCGFMNGTSCPEESELTGPRGFGGPRSLWSICFNS